MQIHNCEQGSPEWYNLRLGKFTGSEAYKLFGTSQARENYIYSKACEIITGGLSDSDSISLDNNIHIARGKSYEWQARSEYTATTLSLVEQVGFITMGDYLGYSPDGLVGSNGMIEIKCPDTTGFLKSILAINTDGDKAIAKEHYTQMQTGLLVTDRQWCDYVLYNARHPKSLYVHKVERDDILIKTIFLEIKKATKEIEKIVNDYNLI